MQHTPYTLPVIATGAVALGAATHVFRRHLQAVGGREFVVVALSMATISFAYAGELASATLSFQLFWLNVRYVGICIGPLASLLLALRYTGRVHWLATRRVLALAWIPALTLLLAWTNEWHFLVQGPSQVFLRGTYVLRRAESHVAFYVFLAYAYACLLAVIALYGRAMFASQLQRRQAGIFLIATVIPLATNIVYQVGGFDAAFDVSSIGYAIACILWTWAIRRERMFDLVPLAREEVIDSMLDALLVLDADGRVLDANPAARALFKGHERLVGMSLDVLLGPNGSAALLANARRELMIAEQSFDARPVRIATKSGARGAIVTLRDVSAERKAQRERDAALDLATRANQAKADFLARMSHEVRTPLHAVLGAADLLATSELPVGSVEYVDAIEVSARALLAIVDEILDFSRIDARAIDLELESCDAAGILEELRVAFEPIVRKKGLSLFVEGAAPPVLADLTRLRQILTNFIGNAIKFTERGSIVLRARGVEDGVRFEVEDSGIGIPASAKDTVFAPFVQVQGAPRDGVAGLGLGLSIAKELAIKMGGAVGVESVEACGSTFWLRLPRGHEVRRSEHLPSTNTGRRTQRRAVFLVVDDHPVSRLATVGLLEREGGEAHGVEGPTEALRALGTAIYDLVFTDIRMPVMDGHAFMAEARARYAGGAIARLPPVVALTADVVEGAREKALGAGMVDWLSKPLDAVRLRRVLDRWLGADEGPVPSADDGTAFLVDLFRETTPRDLDAIRSALEAGDAFTFEALCHRLKGAAVLVGANDLQRLCDPASRPPLPPEAFVEALTWGYKEFVNRQGPREAP